jgi:hypothetical protein
LSITKRDNLKKIAITLGIHNKHKEKRITRVSAGGGSMKSKFTKSFMPSDFSISTCPLCMIRAIRVTVKSDIGETGVIRVTTMNSTTGLLAKLVMG